MYNIKTDIEITTENVVSKLLSTELGIELEYYRGIEEAALENLKEEEQIWKIASTVEYVIELAEEWGMLDQDLIVSEVIELMESEKNLNREQVRISRINAANPFEAHNWEKFFEMYGEEE